MTIRLTLATTPPITPVGREIKILKKNLHNNVIQVMRALSLSLATTSFSTTTTITTHHITHLRQLFEVLDTEQMIYLIMEHADGGEMFDYIVKHNVRPANPKKIMHLCTDEFRDSFMHGLS